MFADACQSSKLNQAKCIQGSIWAVDRRYLGTNCSGAVGIREAPRTSDSVRRALIVAGEGVLAGEGVDGAGMVEDDATKARSADDAHVERTPAGSTPRPHAHHAPRLQMQLQSIHYSEIHIFIFILLAVVLLFI